MPKENGKIRFDQQAFLLRIRDLPVIPTAIAEIIKIANDPGSSAVDIEWAVGRDQSVAGKVLKLVNSAVYGFTRRIENIRQAIVMLGLRKMRDIAISMAGSELFIGIHGDLVKGVELWTHSLATMLWARYLINLKHWVEMESVVTAALLHDIGIVVLCQYAHEEYTSVLQEAKEEQRHHERIEYKRFKTTHAKIAASLCAKWQFPIAITQLISQHHTLLTPDEPALAILMLADHLSYDLGYRPFFWSAPFILPKGIQNVLELSEQEMKTIHQAGPTIQEQVEDYQRVLTNP